MRGNTVVTSQLPPAKPEGYSGFLGTWPGSSCVFLPGTKPVTLVPWSLARRINHPHSSVSEILSEAVRKPRLPSSSKAAPALPRAGCGAFRATCSAGRSPCAAGSFSGELLLIDRKARVPLQRSGRLPLAAKPACFHRRFPLPVPFLLSHALPAALWCGGASPGALPSPWRPLGESPAPCSSLPSSPG